MNSRVAFVPMSSARMRRPTPGSGTALIASASGRNRRCCSSCVSRSCCALTKVWWIAFRKRRDCAMASTATCVSFVEALRRMRSSSAA